jgi:hypothetical protein
MGVHTAKGPPLMDGTLKVESESEGWREQSKKRVGLESKTLRRTGSFSEGRQKLPDALIASS